MRRMMSKRPKTSSLVDIQQREVGELPPRTFTQRVRASEDIVLRLDIYKNLSEHIGCVNTVSFNADGGILISGSDDRYVKLWDWDAGRVKLSFYPGHTRNIFQAKIMPFTDDRRIVTCAADGQVRCSQVLENGQVETVMLAKHQGRAQNLAILPGSPDIFFSCGEDGVVQHFDLRTGTPRQLFRCKALHDKSGYMPLMPIIHLNCMTIDPMNPNIIAVAGSDEFARLYDIRKYNLDGSNDFGHPLNYFCPPHLVGDMRVGISGLTYSEQRELVVSYNDEHIYLFARDMGLGSNPLESNPTSEAFPLAAYADDKAGPQLYEGHKNRDTLKSVSFFGPGNEFVLSGSDCGRIFIWRKKGGQLLRVMDGDKHVVNFIGAHPHLPIFASSGIEHDIKIWTPEAIEKASLPVNFKEVLIPNRIAFVSIGYDNENYSPGGSYSNEAADTFSDYEDDFDSDEVCDDIDRYGT